MSQTTDIATMHDIVREEIRRQQASRRAKAELERIERIQQEHLLAERMGALRMKYNRRPNPLQRLWRPVENAWCMIWAIWFNAGEIFLNWCMRRGWIEEVESL